MNGRPTASRLRNLPQKSDADVLCCGQRFMNGRPTVSSLRKLTQKSDSDVVVADTGGAGEAEPRQFLHLIVEGAAPGDASVAVALQ